MAKQKIQIELGFMANTNQAEQALKKLSTQLDSIATGKNLNLDQGLTKEIQSGVDAAQRLNAVLKSAMNTNTGNLDLGKFQQSLKQSGLTIQSLKQQLQGLGPTGQQAFLDLAKAVNYAEVPVLRINKTIQKMGQTLANTMRWQISSSVLQSVSNAFQSAFNYAEDLNESLNNIRIVTGYGAEEMDNFAAKANKLAKALSTTTTEYTNASLIYFQQGLSDAEVEKRTQTTIKLANVTGESAETVSEWMTAVWNNFDDGSKSLEHYANVMTALGAATASSSDEIAGGLEKFAAIAKTIGLSYEYAASALATVTAITRQSEDVVGTAFKTIFGRMEGLTLGEELDDGTNLNKYSQALKTVGVDIMNASGELKNMDTILNELGARWDNLTQAQKVALAQTVGGMRQYNQLIALMDNWDYFQQNLEISLGSEGALNEQAEIYAESWEAARDRVTAAAEAIYQELLNDDVFIKLLDFFADFLGFIDQAIDSIGGLKGVLLLLGTVITNVYSKQLTSSLSNIGLFINSLTKSGRAKIEQQKKEIWEEANKMPLVAGGGDVSDTQATAFERELRNEEKLYSVTKDRSKLEQDIYRQKADFVKLQQQEAVNAAKAKEDANERLKIEEGILEKAQTKQSELQIEKTRLERRRNYVEKGLGNATAEQSIKWEKKLKAINQELAQTNRELDRTNAQVDTSLEGVSKATIEAEVVTEKYTRSVKNADTANSDFNKELNGLAPITYDYSEVIVGLANGLMQVGFAMSSLTNIEEIWDNNELTVTEKISQIFMSLSSIIPLLVSGYKALTSQKLKDTLATWKQVAAEATLKKIRSDSETDYSKYFTQKDGKWQFNGQTINSNTKVAKKLNAGEVVSGTDLTNKQAQTIASQKTGIGATLGQGVKSMLPSLLKTGAVLAGIAIIIGTIWGTMKLINRKNELADRAAAHAKQVEQAYQKAKSKVEELKSTISSYNEGVKGLKELTKGTQEYTEAVMAANDQAIKLIQNNNDLKWHYNTDGLIEFDDKDALETYEKEQQYELQKMQAASLAAEAMAQEKGQEAAQQEYLRDNIKGWENVGTAVGTGLAWGAAGAAAGALIGTVFPGIGNLVGAAVGAIVGGVAGVVAGAITGATTGMETKEETAAMEKLYAEYERLSRLGQQQSLATEEGIRNALKGFDKNLVDALAKNADATYDLIESNAAAKNVNMLANQAMVQAINVDNKNYEDNFYKELMTIQKAKEMGNKDSYEYKKLYDQMYDKYTSFGTNLFGFINTHGQDELWDRYIKGVYGENAVYTGGKPEEGQYRVKQKGGDTGKLEVYENGKWIGAGDIERSDALDLFVKQDMAEISDKDAVDMAEEYDKKRSALFKAGIEDLTAQFTILSQMIKNEDEAITDLSQFNQKQIDQLKNAGFNTQSGEEYRNSSLKDIQENLNSIYEKNILKKLIPNLNEVSEVQYKTIADAVERIFNTGGANGLYDLQSFLSQYTVEEQAALSELINTFDFSVADPVQSFIAAIDELNKTLPNSNIQINETDKTFLSFINTLQNSTLAAMAFGNGITAMAEKTAKALSIISNLKLGDVLDPDKYKELIASHAGLQQYFIKTLTGYKSLISGAKLTDIIAQNYLDQGENILDSAFDAMAAVQGTRGDEIKASINKVSSGNDQELKNYIYKQTSTGGFLTEDILKALGTSREQLLAKDANSLKTFLMQVNDLVDNRGIDQFNDTINTVIDAFLTKYSDASVSDVQQYLQNLETDKGNKLTNEQIKEYLNNWGTSIKLRRFENYSEKVLNGKYLERIKENADDLTNSFSKLDDRAFSAAQKMANLSSQLNNITKQKNIIQNGMPDLLTEEDFKKMSAEEIENYYEILNNTENQLKVLLQNITDIDKQMADTVLSAFKEWNDEFEKINSKAEHFGKIINSYKNIVALTREFTDIDASTIKILNDAAVQVSETEFVNSKNKYESLVKERQKIEDEYNQAIKNNIGGNSDYWKKQLEEIDNLIADAQLKYFESWEAALQAAADSYKNTIESMFNDFEREMTGSFGSYDRLLEYYDQQSKLAQFYLQDYERYYELSKLSRELNKNIEETTSLKSKQNLYKIQEKINKLQQDGVKMSKYELQYLQKEYELEIAKIALEEAQNAKNKVQLTRNASGGWGYVYTSDDNSIEEAKSKYEQSLYELQKLNAEYIDEITKSYLEIEKEWVEKLASIYTATDLTESEREEAIKNANAYYSGLMQNYTDQLEISIADNNLLYSGDTQKYIEANNLKISANNNYYESFKEKVLKGTLEGYDSIESRMNDFKTKLGNAGSEKDAGKGFLGNVTKAYQEYKDASQKILVAAGSDFDILKQTIEKYVGKNGDGENSDKNTIIGELEKLGKTSEVLTGNMVEDFKNLGENLKRHVSTVVSRYNSVRDALREIEAAAIAAWQAQHLNEDGERPEVEETEIKEETEVKEKTRAEDLWNLIKDDANFFSKILNPKDYYTKYGTYLAYQSYIDEAYARYEKGAGAEKSIDYINNYYKENGLNKNTPSHSYAAKKIKEKEFEDNNFEINSEQKADILYPRTPVYPDSPKFVSFNDIPASSIEYLDQYTTVTLAEGNDVIREEGSLKYTKIKLEGKDGYYWVLSKGLIELDTGGYTGNWGPEGRLAMLHEKEIVLNKEDTANFLSALGILDSIVSMINLQAASRSIDTQLWAGKYAPGVQTLEQQVTIHAEFPNATNHNEIKEAFNNLINTASQYANRKI